MEEQFIRTAFLVGDAALERLKRSRVILFGVGGVGSYCAEALARAGIGTICLVDPDSVSESNINRQLVALHSSGGQSAHRRYHSGGRRDRASYVLFAGKRRFRRSFVL